jgi:predicted PurR-regulated permease PerM
LAFFIVIHKLEYFLSARAVGTPIRARAWELLIAMLIMETLFGIAGLVAAPVCTTPKSPATAMAEIR